MALGSIMNVYHNTDVIVLAKCFVRANIYAAAGSPVSEVVARLLRKHKHVCGYEALHRASYYILMYGSSKSERAKAHDMIWHALSEYTTDDGFREKVSALALRNRATPFYHYGIAVTNALDKFLKTGALQEFVLLGTAKYAEAPKKTAARKDVDARLEIENEIVKLDSCDEEDYIFVMDDI